MTPTEEAGFWDTHGRRLAGVMHVPESDKPRAAVLVVHPFAEEKKFSYRVLVNLARELARRDVAVLRFDLSGCGDSSGDSVDCTLADWRADVASACGQLSARFDDAPQVLMGLRLGATLALDASCNDSTPPSPRLRRAGPPALVLWEPVISGRKYVDEILRRRMIKEMMTTGRKATGREAVLAEIETDGYLDLDGIAVGRRLIEELSALDANALAGDFTGRAFCVQIAFNAKVSSALESLAEAMRQAGADARAIGIREQVIWDRVELVEATELIAATAGWISSL